MKPLIIGEAPGKNGDPRKPIQGRIGARLAETCGLTPEEYEKTFVRLNLLPSWPGPAGIKGDAFDRDAAELRAKNFLVLFKTGRIVILLGKRVAGAFGLKRSYFQEQRLAGARVYVVPHPSGINRWFNSQANRDAMRQFMVNVVWAASTK